MANNSVDVKPYPSATSRPIAVDTVGGKDFPVYKQAFGVDGEQTSVSGSNPLPVAIKDTYTQIVNQYAIQYTATSSTVAVENAPNDYTLEIVSAVGFAVNDHIHINTSTIETTNPKIISIAGNILTLDRRLDFTHQVGDTVTKVILDMALAGQVGTLAVPQEYELAPPPGEIWHITRLLFSMVHGTAGDLGLFGNLTALINGVVLRAYIGGQYYTLTNWKSNSDIKLDMYDVEFDPRSGGQGNFGTSGRGTFTNAGVILRLNGALGDKIEIYIQDDITALGFFGIKFQGHLSDV